MIISMTKVGITGQIASGKTFAARFFRSLGAYVINADRIGHSLYKLPEIKAQMIEAFGSQILSGDETIRREKLSDIVFSSEKELLKLNKIMYPPLEEKIAEKVNRLESSQFPGIVVIDAALLGEWDIMRKLDYFILIDCPTWHQMNRLVKERHFEQKAAEARIEFQKALTEKVTPFVDFIIRNPGEPAEFRRKLIKIWMHIKGIKRIE